jgi:hypothetical protein
MAVFKDFVKIELIDKTEDKRNFLINGTDFGALFSKLAKTYLSNFEAISTRYLNDVRRSEINAFLGILLLTNVISDDLKNNIKDKIEAIDNNLNLYENKELDYFSLYLFKIEF